MNDMVLYVFSKFMYVDRAMYHSATFFSFNSIYKISPC